MFFLFLLSAYSNKTVLDNRSVTLKTLLKVLQPTHSTICCKKIILIHFDFSNKNGEILSAAGLTKGYLQSIY